MPLAGTRPALFAKRNALFDRERYAGIAAPRPVSRLLRWLPSPTVNLAQTRMLTQLGTLLAPLPAPTVLVVGSGGQRADLAALLARGGASGARLVCTDVDAHADVDCFCDAHELPFPDASFDALVTTAVLEHVLYPEAVAAEIARVVRVGGFLYSEVPFMQQVHEGAYDFTRYTLSGHRRVLNSFTEVDAGLVAGPATALVWALESLAAAPFVNPRLARAARLGMRVAVFWIKYADYAFRNRPAALDGASGTYFLGRRADLKVADEFIIRAYRGSRPLHHN